jgi:DNA-binding transcriptional ArsR family regulator
MSRKRKAGGLAGGFPANAPLFSALGDRTRLQLIGHLSLGQARSISELAAGSDLTRQAITKHLRILEEVGLVQAERRGREIRFTFLPQPMDEARRYLELVSRRWDQALARLKALVEADPTDRALS